MSWGGAGRACLAREEYLKEGRKTGLQRWHFQHGPIDLIIGIEGDSAVLDAAIERAWLRFERVLEELVAELAFLKTPVPTAGSDLIESNSLNDEFAGYGLAGLGLAGNVLAGKAGSDMGLSDPKTPRLERPAARGLVAQSMFQSCAPYGLLDAIFVTPMAAVAGCVAQNILAFLKEPGIDKSWVNNGGDIAWYAPPHSPRSFSVGIPELSQSASIILRPVDQCWGIATSGWRGRSQSFGIADSVTVIAPSAGSADVAATLIANQVSLRHLVTSHPEIVQKPANQMKDDSDLGDRLVTVSVGVLSGQEVSWALAGGEIFARLLISRGWISGAVLCLQGQFRVCGGFNPQVPEGIQG
jgi:uncharacterized protein